VGLSGVRAAVLSDGGRLLATARRAVTPTLGHGRAEGDADAWLAAALDCGRRALDQAGAAVAAVGVSALGPAPILVDESLQALTPALLFALDTRAERERERLGVTHDHALPKVLWWREHAPDLWERTAWALDPTGFIVSRLTGSPTMDAITRADYLAPGLEAPLPEPLDPLAVAGELVVPDLGAPVGTPVLAGTYDTYVDAAGCGVRRPGDACILLGSTLVVCRAVGEPVECPGLELAPYPGEGLLLGGWTATGGSVLGWWERALGEPPAVDDLELGAGGLLALPYFAGERTPVRDPDARGLVLGLTLATTRKELYRALVDALALAARDHFERLAAVGLAPDWWLVSGGGVHNRAWLQATGDALGTPLVVAPHAGAAVGPARLALRAIGREPDLPPVEEVRPDAARHEHFGKLYGVYRDLHPALAGAMGRLAALG
jgi:xylulokinase